MSQWGTAETADWKSYLTALYPKAREWDIQRHEIYVAALRHLPIWAVKESIRDLRTKDKGETAPSPVAVAAGGRAVTSAFLAKKEREGKWKRDQEANVTMTPQEFAEDEEFWASRLRTLNPRKRESYQHLREVLRRGGFPGLTVRDPETPSRERQPGQEG